MLERSLMLVNYTSTGKTFLYRGHLLKSYGFNILTDFNFVDYEIWL